VCLSIFGFQKSLVFSKDTKRFKFFLTRFFILNPLLGNNPFLCKDEPKDSLYEEWDEDEKDN